jgi:hypothetical protein
MSEYRHDGKLAPKVQFVKDLELNYCHFFGLLNLKSIVKTDKLDGYCVLCVGMLGQGSHQHTTEGYELIA